MTEPLLQRAAAFFVSKPWVYELVQNAAGRGFVVEKLKAVLPEVRSGLVLDLGSSGGELSRRLGLRPVCLDIDARSVLFARQRQPDAVALVGDGADLPFPAKCFELSLCVDISHHLPDGAWPRMLAELRRVTSGTLVFLDAVRDDARFLSRFLWRYDRGRFPRRRDEILQAVGREFVVRRVTDFSVYHRYVLCVANPNSVRASPTTATESSAG
jgi:SAM-dependent methyltransferase